MPSRFRIHRKSRSGDTRYGLWWNSAVRMTRLMDGRFEVQPIGRGIDTTAGTRSYWPAHRGPWAAPEVLGYSVTRRLRPGGQRGAYLLTPAQDVDRDSAPCGQCQTDPRGVVEEAADAPASVTLIFGWKWPHLELAGPVLKLELEHHVVSAVAAPILVAGVRRKPDIVDGLVVSWDGFRCTSPVGAPRTGPADNLRKPFEIIVAPENPWRRYRACRPIPPPRHTSRQQDV